MNYYYDTEFLEGTQKRWFGRKTKPTIDLISIGIVAEDGREYYAISKDFNLKEAWNRFQIEIDDKTGLEWRKYWIRDNVLRSIFDELYSSKCHLDSVYQNVHGFSYYGLKFLIDSFGKSNTQIADEVKMFIGTKEAIGNWEEVKDKMNTNLYGYYSAYDHVVFCWLFGKMLDLPEGFPMYTRDLKQMLDEKPKAMLVSMSDPNEKASIPWNQLPGYPRQDPLKAHNALEDARWNKLLHEFIKSL